MTNQYELDKAIERAPEQLQWLRDSNGCLELLEVDTTDLIADYEQLLTAAKRVKELELQFAAGADMAAEMEDLQSKLAAAKQLIKESNALFLEIKDWAYDNDYECGSVGAALMSEIEKLTASKTERD